MIDLPSQPTIEIALVAVLRQHGPMLAKDAVEYLAVHFELNDAQRQLQRADGRGSKFANRVQWARNKLADEGVIDRSRHGIWSLKAETITVEDLMKEALEYLASTK